jgi:hypothetical protein
MLNRSDRKIRHALLISVTFPSHLIMDSEPIGKARVSYLATEDVEDIDMRYGTWLERCS